MLPKAYRLNKKEFVRTFQKGRTFVSDDFVIKYSPRQRSNARFGFSVGLKISKKATIRNALRRQLYICVERLLFPQLQIPAGDYVIIMRPHEEPFASPRTSSSLCPGILKAMRGVIPYVGNTRMH